MPQAKGEGYKGRPKMKKEVLSHYDSLASEFTNLSNKYCNSRYLLELEKYVKPSCSVLEVGCGTGLLLSGLGAGKKAGCDLSGKLLSQIRSADFLRVQADAEFLPFKDRSFDVVYSINLLEHVPHPERVIKESQRVLKKGGKLILITPNGDWNLLLEVADRLGLKAPEGPHHFLTSGSLKRLLARRGISILTSRKMVIVPSGPGFLKRFGERLEKKTGSIGFFHLAVAEKLYD